MGTRPKKLAAAALIVAMAGVGGYAYAGSSAESSEPVDGRLSPSEMLERRGRNEPLPVMDPRTGAGSGGFVRDSDLTAQDDRVAAAVDDLGIVAEDPRWDEVARALMVIEAAPVSTREGVVIGYMGTQFIPAAEYPEAKAAATAAVERLASAG